MLLTQALIPYAIADNYGKTLPWIGVGVGQLAFWIILFAICESWYRYQWYRETPFVKPTLIMTPDDFEERLIAGEKLMILDDLVLDVGKFVNFHPGGKFLIEHCVGTDIAKFFYGGYNLEGNMGPKPAFGYKHSNFARRIVNDIAIAQYDCP